MQAVRATAFHKMCLSSHMHHAGVSACCTPETACHNTTTLINTENGVLRQGGIMNLLLLSSLHLWRLRAFTHGLLLLLLGLQIACPQRQIVTQQLHNQSGILV